MRVSAGEARGDCGESVRRLWGDCGEMHAPDRIAIVQVHVARGAAHGERGVRVAVLVGASDATRREEAYVHGQDPVHPHPKQARYRHGTGTAQAWHRHGQACESGRR